MNEGEEEKLQVDFSDDEMHVGKRPKKIKKVVQSIKGVKAQ